MHKHCRRLINGFQREESPKKLYVMSSTRRKIEIRYCQIQPVKVGPIVFTSEIETCSPKNTTNNEILPCSHPPAYLELPQNTNVYSILHLHSTHLATAAPFLFPSPSPFTVVAAPPSSSPNATVPHRWSSAFSHCRRCW
jgi:hypothetical protein